jgi:hypothetical protein
MAILEKQISINTINIINTLRFYDLKHHFNF